MGLREFEDGRGGRWRVWDTVPMRRDAMGGFRSGWLTFDNGSERRRLAPIPPTWEELPDERLVLLLRMTEAPQGDDPIQAVRTRAERRERDRREHERRDQDRRVGDRRRGWR